MHRRSTIELAYLVAVLVLLANIHSNVAEVYRAKFKNPANPGKCTVSPKIVLSPGQQGNMPDQCAGVSCLDADGTASIYNCAATITPESCKKIGKKAPYPLCCKIPC